MARPSSGGAAAPDASADAEEVVWVEVEDVDLDTGELLGTRLEAVTPDGHPLTPAEVGGRTPPDLGTAHGRGAAPVPRAARAGSGSGWSCH